MEVLWKRHPLSANEVIDILAREESWAPNTVRTMLARLVKKGALVCDKKSSPHCYRPAFPREACVREEVDSLVDRLFGGVTQALLVHFIKDRKLTRKQVDSLRRLFDKTEGSK